MGRAGSSEQHSTSKVREVYRLRCEGIFLDDSDRLFVADIRIREWSRYLCVRHGLNFAVMRKKIFADGAGWDTRFRSNGEHEDFYLNLKENTHWEVAYCPDFICSHNHLSSTSYKNLRNRQDGWRLFGVKWLLTHHLEIGFGLRPYGSFEDNYIRHDASPAHSQLPPPRPPTFEFGRMGKLQVMSISLSISR